MVVICSYNLRHLCRVALGHCLFLSLKWDMPLLNTMLETGLVAQCPNKPQHIWAMARLPHNTHTHNMRQRHRLHLNPRNSAIRELLIFHSKDFILLHRLFCNLKDRKPECKHREAITSTSTNISINTHHRRHNNSNEVAFMGLSQAVLVVAVQLVQAHHNNSLLHIMVVPLVAG